MRKLRGREKVGTLILCAFRIASYTPDGAGVMLEEVNSEGEGTGWEAEINATKLCELVVTKKEWEAMHKKAR